MPSLTIKNLPATVYERLKEDAARHRRSLNSEVIARLEQAVLTTPVDPDAFLSGLAALRQRLGLRTPLTEVLLDEARREGRP
jgi:antitoxin FitA